MSIQVKLSLLVRLAGFSFGIFAGTSTEAMSLLLQPTQARRIFLSPKVKISEDEVQARYKYIPLGEIERRTGSNLIGVNPLITTYQVFGSSEPLFFNGVERIEVRYPQTNQATIKITRTGLPDDSINGIRYYVKLNKQPSASGTQWKIVWAGEQFKCQSGRGHQDWSSTLCL